MNYIRVLKENIYIGFLVILLCACLGSIRGALKESGEPFIGVTQDDLAVMDQAGIGAPEMVGIMPLASEQNRWRNFSYAVHYAGRGVVCYCVLMAIYLPVYHCRFFVMLRDFWEKDD